MNFVKMPLAVYVSICKFLPIKSLFHFGLVNQKCSKVLTNELLWKEIAIRDFVDISNKDEQITWKYYVKTNFFEW